jgi:hypothetical protein
VHIQFASGEGEGYGFSRNISAILIFWESLAVTEKAVKMNKKIKIKIIK